MSYSEGMSIVGLEPCVICSGEPARTRLARNGRFLYECARCGLLYRPAFDRPDPEAARRRYLQHRNDPADAGYVAFLGRIVELTRPHLSPPGHGLDYGSGPAPSLSPLFERLGYTMTDYDPVFAPTELRGPYDLVVSTECWEHFHEAGREIARVVELVRPGGVLAVMTEFWGPTTDVATWHYTSDPTHTTYYSRRSMDAIASRYGLTLVACDGARCAVYVRSAEVARCGPQTGQAGSGEIL